MKDIRRTIFELANPDRADDLYDDVQTAVDDLLPSLGFRPSVTLSGPLNTAVPDEVRPHLLAVLREALSNVGRHARATVASISLSARGPAGSAGEPAVELVVEDDGRGIACAAPGNGLPNMMARADVVSGHIHAQRGRWPSRTAQGRGAPGGPLPRNGTPADIDH